MHIYVLPNNPYKENPLNFSLMNNMFWHYHKLDYVVLQNNYWTSCWDLWWLSDDLTRGESQEALFKHNDPSLTIEKDTKTYILKHLDNIKLSRSQYMTTFIINYSLYIYNMFAIENFTHTFLGQLIKVINLKPSTEINRHTMPKCNQLLMDRYSDAVFLKRQMTKQHKNSTMLEIKSMTTLAWKITPYQDKNL